MNRYIIKLWFQMQCLSVLPRELNIDVFIITTLFVFFHPCSNWNGKISPRTSKTHSSKNKSRLNNLSVEISISCVYVVPSVHGALSDKNYFTLISFLPFPFIFYICVCLNLAFRFSFTTRNPLILSYTKYIKSSTALCLH